MNEADVQTILKVEVTCDADMVNKDRFRFTFSTPWTEPKNPELGVLAVVVKRYFQDVFDKACDKFDVERELLSTLAWAKTAHDAQDFREKCPHVIKYMELVANVLAADTEADK